MKQSRKMIYYHKHAYQMYPSEAYCLFIVKRYNANLPQVISAQFVLVTKMTKNCGRKKNHKFVYQITNNR